MGRKSHGTGHEAETPFPRFVGADTYRRQVAENEAIDANLAAALLQHETVGHTGETPQERYDAARRAVTERLIADLGPWRERSPIGTLIDSLAQAAHDLGYDEGYTQAQQEARP